MTQNRLQLFFANLQKQFIMDRKVYRMHNISGHEFEIYLKPYVTAYDG